MKNQWSRKYALKWGRKARVPSKGESSSAAGEACRAMRDTSGVRAEAALGMGCKESIANGATWAKIASHIVLIISLTLAPLALDLRSLGEVGPFAEAASFVNIAVPSNTNLSSGLLLYYSFDSTKFSTTTVTDESGPSPRRSGLWPREGGNASDTIK